MDEVWQYLVDHWDEISGWIDRLARASNAVHAPTA